MIEPMLKIFIVARFSDKKALVADLGKTGVVQLIPFGEVESEDRKSLAKRLEDHEKALKIIQTLEPLKKSGVVSVESVADEILRNSAEVEVLQKNIDLLEESLKSQELWGDLSLRDIEKLKGAGVEVRFFRIPFKTPLDLQGDAVADCGALDKTSKLLLVVNPKEPLPQGVQELVAPEKDKASLEAELLEARSKLVEVKERLSALANTKDDLLQKVEVLKNRLAFQNALDGGLGEGEFFALSGWVPAKKQGVVKDLLLSKDCFYYFEKPQEDEEPPVLITYPRWAQSIAGLFDALNVVPGYREPDISTYFMIFLPIFVAIIIGDAGYGFTLFALGVIFRKKMLQAAGKDKVDLLFILSIVTIIYGILFGSYFGFSPLDLADAGGFSVYNGTELDVTATINAMQNGEGFVASLGSIITSAALLWKPSADGFRNLLTVISFILGCSHLVLAHLVQVMKLFPSQEALAELGWAIFICGMFGIVWGLFLPDRPFIVGQSGVIFMLASGALLSACFSCPNRSWLGSRVPCGVASCALSWIGAFSDMVSYIRLMAVGLSSYYITSIVNLLATKTFEAMPEVVSAGIGFAIIFIVGHTFNIVLAMISILAHGVRLNMLEFSNNAGVQWSGVSYSPFVLLRSKGEL
ncbi:MAG: V-type ATP synthase subunit I [Bdellovibrionota bacterium]|jgi:V/A-type H+-transporting ATPase subunit I